MSRAAHITISPSCHLPVLYLENMYYIRFVIFGLNNVSLYRRNDPIYISLSWRFLFMRYTESLIEMKKVHSDDHEAPRYGSHYDLPSDTIVSSRLLEVPCCSRVDWSNIGGKLFGQEESCVHFIKGLQEMSLLASLDREIVLIRR